MGGRICRVKVIVSVTDRKYIPGSILSQCSTHRASNSSSQWENKYPPVLSNIVLVSIRYKHWNLSAGSAIWMYEIHRYMYVSSICTWHLRTINGDVCVNSYMRAKMRWDWRTTEWGNMSRSKLINILQCLSMLVYESSLRWLIRDRGWD